MVIWRALVMMIVQLNSDRISRAVIVVLPSGVAILIAKESALEARRGIG